MSASTPSDRTQHPSTVISSADKPRPRAPRGRMLIVGQGIDSDLLSRHLQRSPLHAPNLFSAIGEVTIAPAGEPITTVLIAADRLEDGASRAAEALRRVDPSLRIVLMTGDASKPSHQELTGRGFDDWFALPLRLDDIHSLCHEDSEDARPLIEVVQNIPPAPAAPRPVASAPPTPPSSPATSAAARPQQSVLRVEEDADVDDDAPHADAQAWFPSEKSQQIQAADVTGEDEDSSHETDDANTTLGDTDLIEALLYNPDGVRNLALKLIAQHTHWSDLALHESPHVEGPAIHHHVEIIFNDRRFGHLASAEATADELRPWASWLARWLALDQSYHAFRMMTYQDDLTGAWNRRFFDVFLREAIATAARLRRPVTVMVFDIDNFKVYNDHYGHEAGDDILRETVRVLNSIIRQGDRVCRIGGDEFAVIFADTEGPRAPVRDSESGPASAVTAATTGAAPQHPETVDVLARRFQEQICTMQFPKLGAQAHGTLSISGGLATYPWDGNDPDALLNHADQLALESKRKGKNAITLGPGAQEVCRAHGKDGGNHG